MSTIAGYVKALKHINIASYAFYFPTLVIWIGLLIRMLISKDRDKLWGLIVICVLMIVSFVASIVDWQLNYTSWYKISNRDLNHPDIYNQIHEAC